jgi:hypothetical protein
VAGILFLFSVFLYPAAAYGASAQAQDSLEILLTEGKASLTANGVSVPCQKPFKKDGMLYIPLKTVLETMGADVEAAADGTVLVTFRDAAAKVKTGVREFTVNGEKKVLPAAPALSGNTLMIPLDFVKLCFDVTAAYDDKTGKATILLKDDGSLSDLSFLTGSVTASKAGNSYFGWSISLPTGTRVATNSFSSKYVLFENDHYGFDLEISAISSGGKNLQQYYEGLKEDPYTVLGEEPLDVSLNLEAKPQYIEILSNDSYDEAVYGRLYVKGGNCLSVVVTSYDEVNPSKLKKDRTVKEMTDSFSLDYKGGGTDTADLSSVKNGLARYSSYVTSETTGKKYLSWEMSVLPEWDLKSASSSTPLNVQFDGAAGEYIKVELDIPDEKEDTEAAGKKLVESYAKNFNPAFYALKSSGLTRTEGLNCYELSFEVKYGSKLYHYIERLIVENGILYDITFKSPAEAFTKELPNFNKMVATFKTAASDKDKILDVLQKEEFNDTKNNVGKDDTQVIYENKTYKWKLTLPGYWQKSSSSGQSLESFYDANAGALIAVEASSAKTGETAKTDKERFLSMRFYDKITDKPLKTTTEQDKDRSVTIYQYRIDNAESETYADVYYYVFEEGGYRYCFMTMIPDLTTSEFNLDSLKSIRESLEIAK